MNWRYLRGWLFCLLIIAAVTAHAATEQELRQNISQRQSEIDKIDAEIKGYETTLASTAKQSATLQTAVTVINLNIKKLDSQIKRTDQQVKVTQLKIDELNNNIGVTSGQIGTNEDVTRELWRQMRLEQEHTLLEATLAEQHWSDFLAAEDRANELNRALADATGQLRALKTDLGQQADTKTKAKKELEKLNQQLADQKKIAAGEKVRQQVLLAMTKNQEKNYKQLLLTSQQKRDAFAKELYDFESQLRLQINPASLPAKGHGILAWPVANPVITQYFGKTVDAQRLYTSGTHNGIDLRASIGTPIMAAAAGVVAGTGDTDLVCRGASYGRWVLIKHDNGLATLSAHLSLTKVATGQRVAEGDLVGYSGATGYATGPHLHFTVAAAQGTEISTLKSKVCPGVYTIPLFDTRAYLDPVLYL